MNLLEELLEDPHEGVIIPRTKDFGNKGASFHKEFRGELEGLEYQRS